MLITGATGQVVAPAAEALAADNEVWCLGRFGDPGRRERLEALGITTFAWDMGADTLDGVPDDFTHVLHAAADRGRDGDYTRAIGVDCVAPGMLMSHCSRAEGFLFVSSFCVYSKAQRSDHPYSEDDPQSGNTPYLPAYASTKIAAEGTVRAFSQVLGVPTTIARMNVAHGPLGWGGMPVLYFKTMLAGDPILVPRSGDNVFAPIHTDDIARQVPLLWDVASVPATIVNWAGDDNVTEREVIAYISEITGVEAVLEESDSPLRETPASDNTRRRQLIGDCQIDWRDGVARTIEAHYPGSVEALRGAKV